MNFTLKFEFHYSQKYHENSSNHINEKVRKHLRSTKKSQVKRDEMMDILCPKEQLVRAGKF